MRTVCCVIFLITACGIDPEAELASAELRVEVAGIASGAARVELVLRETRLEQAVVGPEAEFYVRRVPDGADELLVATFEGMDVAQCRRVALPAGGALTVDLADAPARCGGASDVSEPGPEDPVPPTENTEDAGTDAPADNGGGNGNGNANGRDKDAGRGSAGRDDDDDEEDDD